MKKGDNNESGRYSRILQKNTSLFNFWKVVLVYLVLVLKSGPMNEDVTNILRLTAADEDYDKRLVFLESLTI